MEASQDVVIGLKAIRPTLCLKYNRQGKLVGGHSFDVNGNARERIYDPRWELWDTDAHGNEYKVMTLQDENGGFLPPSMRLVEMMNLINPEKYGGDLSKMIEALVDSPNDHAANLDTDAFMALCDHLADLYWHARTPRVATLKPIVGVKQA